MDIPQVIREWVPAIGTFGGLLTAGLAYRNYRRQTQLEKLKWLQQLYESFYYDERYKRVRQLLDFDDLSDLLTFLAQGEDESRNLTADQRDAVDRFTDYLNFFEWIAILENRGQLTFEDLDDLFNYYISRMVTVDKRHGEQITRYMKDNGYGQFHRLLVTHYGVAR